MAQYTAQFDETFQVPASPQTVLAQFLDLDQVVEFDAFGQVRLKRSQLFAGGLRFLLEEQNHGVFQFQGRYDCRYLADGDNAVVWESLGEGGNVWTKGRATVAPSDGGTALHYTAEMTIEIEANKMLAPLLKPVVEASIPMQMKAYVKRMLKALA